MATGQKIIYVYDDFSFDSPVLLGRLYVGVIKGGESFSFEYDSDWLKKTALPVDIDPELLTFLESVARGYSDEIIETVRDNWEKMASYYGLSRGQIEEMRPAFSLCYM